VCMPGASPRHSFGLGQVLVSPVAHTPALRPPNAPSAVRAVTGGLRRPRRFCLAWSAPRRPRAPRPARAARWPRTLQPRQHVTQAGDPRTQRVKCGPTGLVWFYGRWDSWEKAENVLTVTWIFPDGWRACSQGAVLVSGPPFPPVTRAAAPLSASRPAIDHPTEPHLPLHGEPGGDPCHPRPPEPPAVNRACASASLTCPARYDPRGSSTSPDPSPPIQTRKTPAPEIDRGWRLGEPGSGDTAASL
jgi:hypothetical protein